MHVDFLIEDAYTNTPFLGIEIDGPQHTELLQDARDRNKQAIFDKAGVPLLHFPSDTSKDAISQKVEDVLAEQIKKAANES